MKKLLLAVALVTGSFFSNAQAQINKTDSKEDRAKVMFLGTFHFSYRNKDIIVTEKKDQLDVMSPEAQKDLEKVNRQLAKFKPTKIAVEVMPEKQAELDSLYQAYLEGRYTLTADEVYQIGFKLAKELGHQRLYCINTMGDLDTYQTPGATKFELREDKKERMEKFWTYMRAKTLERAEIDKELFSHEGSLYKVIQRHNHPETIRRKHENYFREAFQYEEKPYDYTGVDWYSATWFNRNLRIFRNIQRITESPDDRILVIYGAAHVALLQEAVESSPTHQLVPVHKLLR
ncbi:hypothetical protein CLV24_14412 [Pontibacter ummariensis]|uniref:TraB family protein n=1 Tax=Pontibacter ummariensis TaxID=1610492 RepID=A0A239LMI7_9BACT|nr:DUF5694 domain-containing protein [Pontibacter ummariensis]PRY02943.1 hypothetical protein CLV24_14412 [Pontibacter ummariensis]SNT31595.1 hypothetical protein SAMN06296052_14512 [Pontibacter ummariensis]